MKNRKAPGMDGTPAECLKALDHVAIDRLIRNKIYSTGHIPENLFQSIFVKLPKKPIKLWDA